MKNNFKEINKNITILELKNCIDCPFHETQPDPDPQDWFCDDDIKVICTKTKKI